jgi:pSer/pThr/pTyr-binding forkhead associated (FHA) protein
VARLLTRNDGGTDIVHVLGRRTLVGRGTDCQLQIDAEFVSRRHALLQISADETVIEDLNSTNGVYINGQRVTRQALKEGDTVMIGKTVFRYLLKPVTEREAG